MPNTLLKKDDLFTLPNIGYAESGRLIIDGRYADSKRKTKQPIVKPLTWKVVFEAINGVMPCALS